ncbi:MAG: hypothetical protein ATN36_05150 [Epulopiscium sp. Nele67-Bin005]|nr:MAG: hypothetical protein ATN36_05150 [Epulopiscium sp. Nele67-Bin005]
MVTVSQVAQASEAELLCLTYQIFIDHIEEARNNPEKREYHLTKARETIKVLVNGLNFKDEIAHTIFNIYVYVQKLMLKEESWDEACKIMAHLQETYRMAGESIPKQQQTLQNSQQIYAGGTYGTSGLTEVIMNNDNRGFQA